METEGIGRAALLSGTLGSLASTLALMALSRAEGNGALQPMNATSHWLNGEGAAKVRQADLAHTAVGYATHHAATLFWALPFQAWLAARGRHGSRAILGHAVATAAIASAVDYGATPKRFTPGWEFVLSRRAMALTYGAMAVGLAAGALVARQRARRRAAP